METCMLGPENSAYGSLSYAPQSYRNAMMGGPVAGSSSAYSQNHSTGSVVNASHPYPQAPNLVSAPLFPPHASDRIDQTNPIPVKPSHPFGMVGHHDMLQNGTHVWTERRPPQRNGSMNLHGDHTPSVSKMQSLDLNAPMLSRSQDHLTSEFPACTSGRQNHVLPDEFPHLDIINELLDDEHGVGMAARLNPSYQRFGNGAHMNRQYTFPGDSVPSVSSCGFERTHSYHDDVFQHGFGTSGRSYDSVRDMIPGASSRPYLNGQAGGFLPNQWQMAGSDSPLLSVRTVENDGYPYHIPEYPNLGVGINGYTVFRPSNGL